MKEIDLTLKIAKPHCKKCGNVPEKKRISLAKGYGLYCKRCRIFIK